MSETDREKGAIRALQRGDRSAIRVIYDLHAARLFRSVLMPILRDRAASEDALRETFLSAMEGVGSFSGDTAFPWLSTIARNKAVDSLRAAQTRERVAEDASHAEATPQPSPEEVVAQAEQREQARARIEAVLARMNPRYAEALRLRLVEERDRQDCAARMSLTMGTFDVLFFRACKSFRSLYVQQYGAEP